MPVVFIPPQLRKFTKVEQVRVGGQTVREVIAELDDAFPGIGSRLLENGELAPTLQLSVDSVMTRRLSSAVSEKTEVHFLPVIGGG